MRTILALFVIFLYFSFYPNLSPVRADSHIFHIQSYYDYAQRDTIAASLKLSSEHAYIFVEDNFWNRLSDQEKPQYLKDLNKLAQEFDNTIYPGLTSFYGDPWSPGIDKDSKITILFTHMENNVAGYFLFQDEFSKRIFPSSNEREMLYLNAQNITLAREREYLAHEFQHLINWNQKKVKRGVQEETWLNEMKSEIAPTILGYDDQYKGSNLENRVRQFFASPTSFIPWRNSVSNYGAANLFAQYLSCRVSRKIFSLSEHNSSTGVQSLNEALSQLGSREDFKQLFKDWLITNFVNNPKINSGLYAYCNRDIKQTILPRIRDMDLLGGTEKVFGTFLTSYGFRWYGFKPGRRDLDFVFSPGRDSGLSVLFVKKYMTGQVEAGEVILDSEGGEYLVGSDENVESLIFIPVSFSEDKKPINFHLLVRVIPSSSPVIYRAVPAKVAARGQISFKIYGKNLEDSDNIYLGDFGKVDLKLENAHQGECLTERAVYRTGFARIKIEAPDGRQGYSGAGIQLLLSYPVGAILKINNTERIYLLKEDFIRPVQNPSVLEIYRQRAKGREYIVGEEDVSLYRSSSVLRAADDFKVYLVDASGQRRWLNITPRQFISLGYNWTDVSVVSPAELNLYQQAEPISL